MCLLCVPYTNVYPVCFPDRETQEESSWTTSDQRQTVPLSDEELRQRRLLHLESKFLKVSQSGAKKTLCSKVVASEFPPYLHHTFLFYKKGRNLTTCS